MKVDVKSILSLPREHRCLFIAFLAVLSVALFLIDVFVVPELSAPIRATASAYAQELSAALIVSIIIFWIVTSFLPNVLSSQELHHVAPDDISQEIENLLAGSLRWRYTGNFGRHLRGKILPALAGRSNVQIVVSIIDPLNKPLCDKHADYRNSISSSGGEGYYDADKVALEVVVTIVYCAWYVANKKMSIELSLLSVFDPLRIDSNDDAMILTIGDRSRPALKLIKNHFMYNHFDLKMRYEREQGRSLDLSGFSKMSDNRCHQGT